MSEKIDPVQTAYRQFSLRDFYYVLFRHKGMMLLFFIVVIATVTLGIMLSPAIYRSEAQLLIRLGRESVTLDPTATTGQIIPVSESRERQINTELALLGSREIIECAVEAIDPEVLLHEEHPMKVSGQPLPRKTKDFLGTVSEKLRGLLRHPKRASLDHSAEAVKLVMANFDIENQSNGSTIDLAYESQNPTLAQKILTQLIESYLEKHIAVHRTPGSFEFFTRQSKHLRSRLEELESELQTLRVKTKISSLEQQQKVLLDRISVLQQDVDTTDTALASSQAKVRMLREILGDLPEKVVTGKTVGFPNYAADEMRARLYELQLREQELVSKFSLENRYIQDIRRQIAAAKTLLAQEEPERTQSTEALNEIYQQVRSALLTEEASLASLEAQAEVLKECLAAAEEKLRILSDAGDRIKALTREIEIQEANYRKYSDNLEQARIDDALETGKISNVSIVQAATLPVDPVRPRRLLNILLGLLVGIFGAIGLAFVLEYLDHSIRRPEDVEARLRLPLLTCIPFFRIGNEMDYVAGVEALAAHVRSHSENSQKLHVVAMTGAHSDDGVSTIAGALAVSLAKGNKRPVLLVDANIGQPVQHQQFDTKLSPGLSEALSNGRRSARVRRLGRNFHVLHILTAGKTGRKSTDLLNPDSLRQLLALLQDKYQFVVIDLPAVNEASSVAQLASVCDGVTLVVQAERSRWEVVDSAKELLLQANANILGVILNKRRFYIPNWVYRTL